MFSSFSSNVTSWLGGTQPDDSPPNPEEKPIEIATPEKENTSSSKPTETPTSPAEEQTNEETTNTEAAPEAAPESEAALQDQLDEVGAKAVNTAKEWGTWLYGVGKEATKEIVKTAKVVKDTVEEKTILGEFHKEQDKFVNENTEKKKKSEVGVAPWIGYNEEEEMKKQILALSQDQRNFMRNPPAGVQFQFDYGSMYPVAMAVLQEDENLKKMRFQLVPKSVKEEDFWRNYFYRVSLIKQSAQLTSLAQSTGSTGEASDQSKSTESLRVPAPSTAGGASRVQAGAGGEAEGELTAAGSPPENEFISDAFQDSDYDEEALKKEMQQLGMQEDGSEQAGTDGTGITAGKKKGGDDIPEWERELQAELQEYEVVDDGNALDDADLEQEILQQLESENQA